jgi:D-alanine-D-alanine ligase
VAKVTSALKKGGHEAEPIIADRHLLERLDRFLPRQTAGKISGIVFNVALGIQGNCRYTHLPGMLEMAGIPYTGSNPLGHALALDKVAAKQILIASGIPTPRFVVFDDSHRLAHDLKYPLVVKPRSEAASFGLSVVQNPDSLREAVSHVLKNFQQPALVEEYICGREINISLYGNNPPVVLPILELQMRDSAVNVFSHDLKFDHTGTRVNKICPADLAPELTASLQAMAVRTFEVLNIYDHARVDIRLDENNHPYVLELNSMVSINPTSSLVYAAKVVGLDYDALINKILESACLRYGLEG